MDWWILGFSYQAVIDAWQDARLADALERLWTEAGKPAAVDARWRAAHDEYAFHWYLNPAAAELLDRAAILWRPFVTGRCAEAPADTHSLLAREPSRS